MSDPVETFRTATKAGDIDTLMTTLAPDAELISPLSARLVFRGHEDLRILLAAVYGRLGHLRWTEQIGDGTRRVLLAEAKIGPFRLTEALVLELDDEGRIRTMSPHLRPWLAQTFFAIKLAPRLFTKPGVIRRAGAAPKSAVPAGL